MPKNLLIHWKFLQRGQQIPSNSNLMNSWTNKLDFSVMIVVLEKSSESSFKWKSLAKMLLLNSFVSWIKLALSSKNMLNSSSWLQHGLFVWIFSMTVGSTFELKKNLLLSLILFYLLRTRRSFLLFLSWVARWSFTTSKGSSVAVLFYATWRSLHILFKRILLLN